MKALFVGLGSIGARHLNNLTAICQKREIPLEVTALRATTRQLPPAVEASIHTQVQSLPEGETYDLAFVTNPTNLHAVVLGGLKGRVDTFFIEKPVFDHPDYELDMLGLAAPQKAYVAAPMRWTALYGELKKRIEGWQVYSARAICSSYLPDWRKNVDYRQVYSARSDMGGGVTLDLIHEWDYLYDLFGAPQQSCNLRGQFSHLEVDCDDLSVYIARWPHLLGELHLDYFGREYCRKLELYCQHGTEVADFGTGALHHPDGMSEDFGEDVNCRYLREMEYFLNYALMTQSEESKNSPRLALQVLKTALGVPETQRESAQEEETQ